MLDITTPVFNPFSHNYFRCAYNDMLTHYFHLFASCPVVRTAVEAWRLVLVGRFRLLDQWCEFVEVLLQILSKLFIFVLKNILLIFLQVCLYLSIVPLEFGASSLFCLF